jgi:predicted metal-dependent hydrolase
MSFLLPRFHHHINPGLKHTYLSFEEDGTLLIKSPGMTPQEIEQLLLKKAAWIRRAQQRIETKKGYRPDFGEKNTLYYLGNPFPLILENCSGRQTSLLFEKQKFTLSSHTFCPDLFNRKIDSFYRQEAERYIPPIVEKWAETMSLSPKGIRFRKTRRQWGSCSAKNHLSFNTMLMKLPPETIEYVIVHELAHIRHKHHQKAFWKLVADTMPSYKTEIAVLKTYTPA